MCGIVGYIGKAKALEVIIQGLEKLEYRGYDSAGVALYRDEKIHVYRAQGKLIELKNLLENELTQREFDLGLGHTRWATHGKPSEINAHPHTAGRISLIHNGIIENYIELRNELTKKGCVFKSETDTEIAAHLLNSLVEEGLEPFEALKEACRRITGSYAFLAIDSNYPDRILVAKYSTPIVIGKSEKEVIIASDIPAILNHTRDVIFLEDGDLAEITLDSITIEHNGERVERPVQHITWDPVTAQKGGFKHYMLKEIHDQVRVTADTIRGRINKVDEQVVLSDLGISDEQVRSFKRVQMVACGTAWHACLVARYYIEAYAGIPCEVDYASEFRYRRQLAGEETLFIVVSQSGETLDTLAALEHVGNKATKLAVCNVLGSSITRKADHVVYIHAGPEISVASTKAFTTQILSLYLLARWIGQVRAGGMTSLTGLLKDLTHVPAAISDILKEQEQAIQDLSKKVHKATGFLFIGRGICYPIALEGALKLKEISYIHAEGYPAGELKHGPIALVDENMPVVVVLQREQLLYEKTVSNLREVESRGGKIIVVTDADEKSIESLREHSFAIIKVPFISDALSPILLNIPLQLLAYYVAVRNGTDVDLPRNLAKSVTVE